MKNMGWVVAVCFAACTSGGSSSDPGHDPADPPVDPFARLSDCPTWDQHPPFGAMFCEAICEPHPPLDSFDGCPAVSIGSESKDDGIVKACPNTTTISGMRGCCLKVPTPNRVLFFACSS